MKIKLLLFPLGVYLVWRIVLVAFLLVTKGSLYTSWVRFFDSGQYTGIALNGYQFPQQAFFPLWPLLLRVLSTTGLTIEVSSFILSSLFSLSTFILFYKLSLRLVGRDQSKKSLVLFASFPASIFLLAGYTESLFMTLVLASFLLTENGHDFWGSLFGGLSSATRIVGAAVSLSFLWRRKIPFFFISLSGLLFYILYLWFQFGRPLYFLDADKAWCEVSGRCGLVAPWSTLWRYVDLYLKGHLDINFTVVSDWIASVIFIGFLLPVYKKLKLNYFLYSFVLIITPLMSGSTVGMIRYVLPVFPIFFVLPSLIKSKYLLLVIILLFFLLQLRFTSHFVHNLWVE